ncbi:phosphoribosylanthranilate isomerase [Kurthia sibirica]|uniref:phosphoribosylanthranilate isomerase n=1 Tax=Kurthia sibirica TaxID=202750 RepID=UPI0035EF18B0
MTKIKICGLMTKEHVNHTVAAGADAIGFVFAASKRQINIETAQQLAKDIPSSILKVGVFVNESVENMIHIAKTVPLDMIQLHGDESSQVIEALPFPTIKAFSVRSKKDVEKASTCTSEYLLFDAPGTDFKGGSGNQFDWSLLDDLHIDRQRVILAGGLNSSNIAQAINQVAPAIIDVSSGVETAGVKDPQKITALLNLCI